MYIMPENSGDPVSSTSPCSQQRWSRHGQSPPSLWRCDWSGLLDMPDTSLKNNTIERALQRTTRQRKNAHRQPTSHTTTAAIGPGSCWISGSELTSDSLSAGSIALPRFLLLYTNTKKPRIGRVSLGQCLDAGGANATRATRSP